ncbi:hypothetical protein MGI18_04810 [Bacillus sp. OVS6]|nr:hypothetical protein MGI18_04810 [Bacillus sp. OVS6]
MKKTKKYGKKSKRNIAYRCVSFILANLLSYGLTKDKYGGEAWMKNNLSAAVKAKLELLINNRRAKELDIIEDSKVLLRKKRFSKTGMSRW